jgi:hypothetical protein
MVHGAGPTPDPAPHADPGLARDCDECRGWGTVITTQGHHELCPVCQPAAPCHEHDEALSQTPTRMAAHVQTRRREESPAAGQ